MNENNATIEPTLYVYNPGNGLNINSDENILLTPDIESNTEVEHVNSDNSISVPVIVQEPEPEPEPEPISVQVQEPIDIIPVSTNELTPDTEQPTNSTNAPENNQNQTPP